MRKYTAVLWAASIVLLAAYGGVLADELIWESIARENLDVSALLVDAKDEQKIYIGADGRVLKTEDAGKNWQNILSIKGQNRVINSLSFDCADKNSLYAATGNGLFYSPDQGRSWKRIFKGKNYPENNCAAVRVMPGCIYLGTMKGLFISKDSGRSWRRQAGKLAASGVLAIACDKSRPDYVYVGSAGGVFKTENAGVSWERIFILLSTGNGKEEEGPIDGRDQEEEERFLGIRHVVVDPANGDYLYLAASKGVYKSMDRGRTWNPLSDYGLLDKEVKFLLILPDSTLCAATKAGIFGYERERERWYELSSGLCARDIMALDADRQGNLYAASDKGLFKGAGFHHNGAGKESAALFYYKDEPQISEVQQAAIEYAEVEPEKIIRWRKQAEKKAFFPKVSAGINRDASDLWHWESGSTTKTGDDVLVRGRDTVGWDITLTWDLGEIIWNADQTSIDARSRLMVELRDDILDEVTKLYFERLRVKSQIDELSLEERKKITEKKLRLDELTASLDALTGGYFSSKIR